MEFALTLPAILAIFGMTYSVSMAFWARFRVMSIAGAAVRSCVAQQSAATFGIQTSLMGCVPKQMDFLGGAALKSLCSGGPIIHALAPPIPVVSGVSPQLTRHMYMLTVNIACTRSLAPFAGAGWQNNVTNITMHDTVAMPFSP